MVFREGTILESEEASQANHLTVRHSRVKVSL